MESVAVSNSGLLTAILPTVTPGPASIDIGSSKFVPATVAMTCEICFPLEGVTEVNVDGRVTTESEAGTLVPSAVVTVMACGPSGASGLTVRVAEAEVEPVTTIFEIPILGSAAIVIGAEKLKPVKE